MKEYVSPAYCYLWTGLALSALDNLVTILYLFPFEFSLLLRCPIDNLDASENLSEGTQATEHVDLDLLTAEDYFVHKFRMHFFCSMIESLKSLH